MGFADLLADLGVAYDAPDAVRVADLVMARIQGRAECASEALARERGPFPNLPGSSVAARGLRLRNATLTSIAPTGTLSLIADCSGGIEPYFALAFVRNVLDGQELTETNPRLEVALRSAGLWSDAVVGPLRETGSLRGLAGIPEAICRRFPIAMDIPPESHLDIQEAFQRHVDNAVSKTINLPADATVADVRAIYVSAWRRGLKGVTVFREGCKGEAVLVRGVGSARAAQS
jgi:ribonucleoside-diphosphate reductase alpha chain